MRKMNFDNLLSGIGAILVGGGFLLSPSALSALADGLRLFTARPNPYAAGILSLLTLCFGVLAVVRELFLRYTEKKENFSERRDV